MSGSDYTTEQRYDRTSHIHHTNHYILCDHCPWRFLLPRINSNDSDTHFTAVVAHVILQGLLLVSYIVKAMRSQTFFCSYSLWAVPSCEHFSSSPENAGLEFAGLENAGREDAGLEFGEQQPCKVALQIPVLHFPVLHFQRPRLLRL